MIWFLKVLFVIVSMLSIVILMVDYSAKKISALKRFHIGRWTDEEQWESAVKDRAYHWLNHTPTVRKTDNSRYIFWDIVHGEYRNSTIQSWQTASILLGINHVGDEKGRKAISNYLQSVLTDTGEWKKLGDKVDFALLAYAILKSSDNSEIIKPAMDKVVKTIEKNLCEDGLISYSQGNKSDIRFVDTLGMVCPFLAAYGMAYNKKEYTYMAYMQLKSFREYGLLKGSALPCHAYSILEKKPLGIYGWGRGTAWYFLGMLETWREFSESQEKKNMEQWLREAAEDYVKYQQCDGGFCTILQGGGQYDSSITAAMSYFLYNCGLIFHEQKYLLASERCLEKLKTVTMRNGAIDVCQGDTHGIGIFSQVFDIMPFAQGLVLRTFALKRGDV